MSGRLFYLLSHIIVAVEVKNICDQVQSIIIILNFCVETSQIEPVRQVLLVDLAKVFISSNADELYNTCQYET